MEYKLISEECRLCFYRGDDKCYEKGYLNKQIKYQPNFMDVNEYFLKGCNKTRIKKIKKLKNEHE